MKRLRPRTEITIWELGRGGQPAMGAEMKRGKRKNSRRVQPDGCQKEILSEEGESNWRMLLRSRMKARWPHQGPLLGSAGAGPAGLSWQEDRGEETRQEPSTSPGRWCDLKENGEAVTAGGRWRLKGDFSVWNKHDSESCLLAGMSLKSDVQSCEVGM